MCRGREYLIARCLGANGTVLAIRQWLREDAGVDQAERVPLGASLRLEVPEDPADGVHLECLHLCLDVSTSVVLQLLVPSVDEVDARARTDVAAARVCAIIARANPVSIESGSAVSHGC